MIFANFCMFLFMFISLSYSTRWSNSKSSHPSQLSSGRPSNDLFVQLLSPADQTVVTAALSIRQTHTHFTVRFHTFKCLYTLLVFTPSPHYHNIVQLFSLQICYYLNTTIKFLQWLGMRRLRCVNIHWTHY